MSYIAIKLFVYGLFLMVGLEKQGRKRMQYI